MKQILQDLSSGALTIVDAPAPGVRSGQLLIDTTRSLISTGTERMLVDFGRAGLIAKARQQPDKVRQVLDKARANGVVTTLEAVKSKLGNPIPLGYCNVGVVREVGAHTANFTAGDRVASNGPHADVVSVPQNLCARIPDGVSDDEASFTVVGSIGLQGLRLAEPSLGECFVVIGTGLIGLLTVQLLKAHGCRVLAIDFDPEKLRLAQQFGATICNPSAGEDPYAAAHAFSRGAGVDGVIIAASTKSSDPVRQAAKMCRKRGRIVLVGVTGLELDRADFFDKEISFQVSCSYGPGRYDPAYEQQGQDYPIGYVRWTEQRNFEAVLDLMASGGLNLEPLISHRYAFGDAASAYDTLADDHAALGIMLTYDHPVSPRHIKSVALASRPGSVPAGKPRIGVLGAGNYASRVLIPAFKEAGADLRVIASATGTTGVVHGQKLGFTEATTDLERLLGADEVDVTVIATRPDTHARFAAEALRGGKHVFVEKPLAINVTELEAVEQAYADAKGQLMVGFNRRFAPLVRQMKSALETVHEPKSFIAVMNAGAIPSGNWIQDLDVTGGRIISEACHHVDLLRFLAGSPIVSVQARRMGTNPAVDVVEDKAIIVLGFEDGSFGTIHYLANGGAAFPKERIEVFAAGRTMQLDNFLRLRGYSWPGFRNRSSFRQDKGQADCARAFLAAIEQGAPAPIPAGELFEVSRVTIEAAELLREQA